MIKDKNRIWIILGIIALILLAIFMAHLSSLSSPTTFETVNTVPDKIDKDLAYQKYEEGIFILDVRDPEEWAEYHIPSSTLIPRDELEIRINEVPFDQEVLVICSHGLRSQAGRDILRTAGHTQVSSITGGIRVWKSAGYPTITEE